MDKEANGDVVHEANANFAILGIAQALASAGGVVAALWKPMHRRVLPLEDSARDLPKPRFTSSRFQPALMIAF